MSDSTAQRQFETEIDIAAPREAVWDAIATESGLTRWFAPRARFEAEVGGEVVWEWETHHSWRQRIEVIEPGRRLRTRYDSPVDDGAGGKLPLYMDFTLQGEGGTTTLRLVHSGFGADAGFDGEYDGISRGWPVELQSLRLYLEQHANDERKLVWSKRSLDMDPAEAWALLTGDDGFACGTAVDSMAQGDPFEFHTADGDVFSGTTLHCHAREFSGDVANHGRAFMRFSTEAWAGQTHVWVWMGAYGADDAALEGIKNRWESMLDRLFTTNGAAVSGAA